MPTARQRASLANVLDAEANVEDPTASARLAGMLQRLQALRQSANPPSIVAPVADRAMPSASATAPVAVVAGVQAEGLFYDKGAATADSFRPWYWSYDGHSDGMSEPAELPTTSAAGTLGAKR